MRLWSIFALSLLNSTPPTTWHPMSHGAVPVTSSCYQWLVCNHQVLSSVFFSILTNKAVFPTTNWTAHSEERTTIHVAAQVDNSHIHNVTQFRTLTYLDQRAPHRHNCQLSSALNTAEPHSTMTCEVSWETLHCGEHPFDRCSASSLFPCEAPVLVAFYMKFAMKCCIVHVTEIQTMWTPSCMGQVIGSCHVDGQWSGHSQVMALTR